MPTDLPVASNPAPRPPGFIIESPVARLALIALACGLAAATGIAATVIAIAVDWDGVF